MLTKLFKLLLATLIFQTGYSQKIDTIKLDRYFENLEKHNKFMGSVALLQNDVIVYTKQIGFSNIESKEKSSATTKYKIGSISKTFTATLVLKAIEEGKLGLYDPLSAFFPEIKNATNITIKQLLQHRSGIHNFTNDQNYFDYYTKPITRIKLKALISNLDSDFTPGQQFAYSNSNYVILSLLLEKLYKKNYGIILKEKITTPLQLNNTFISPKIAPKNNESHSYLFSKNWIKQPETHVSIPLGAGAISSTPSDLILFANALFNYKIISKKNVDLMKILKDNYGLGVINIPFYNKTSYGHGGGIDGFQSIFSYFPNDNKAFAITANGTNFILNDISIVLLSELFDKPYTIPDFDTKVNYDAYIGIYSNESFPLKITISQNGSILKAQATGQNAFNLTKEDTNSFSFKPAGIIINFDPTKNQMTFKQGGLIQLLEKEKN